MERQADEEAQDAARDVEDLGAAPELHAHQPYRDARTDFVRQLPQQSLTRTSPTHFSHPNTSGSLLTLTAANAFYMSEAVPASNATHPFWSLKIFVQSPFSAPC